MSKNPSNSTIPPTIAEENRDGTQVEYTDIALANGAFWGSPPKICKGDALLNLNLEEAGAATRLLSLLLLDALNHALAWCRDQGEPIRIAAVQLIRQGSISIEQLA